MANISNRALGIIIYEYMRENDLKAREFAKKCGLSHTYINKLMKGVNNYGQLIEPSIETLKKIAKATERSLVDLLMETGYISEEDIKSYIWGHQLTDMMPEEYKDVVKDLPLVKLIADIKKENIPLEKIKKMIEIVTGYDKK